MSREVKFKDSAIKSLFMVLRGICVYPFIKGHGLLLIGRGVRIRNPRTISRKGRLIIEDFAEIQGLSARGISFGRNVSIGAFSMIRPSGYYSRAIGEGLTVGDNSNIGIMSYIGCGGGVAIGDNVMMGPKVSIHSENHEFDDTEVDMKSQGVYRAGVVIEDDCWLGAGCRILSGVVLGKGAVVAAGAVVTGNVEPFTVVGGIPARLIKHRR
ncbi:MAG: acyltransferase [Gammaproteobacteria bacterium]|nr:acyltransferase [Gammaproteobacteria bacterium]